METKIQKVDEGGMAGEERDSRNEEDVTSDIREEELAPLLASGANATRIMDTTNTQSRPASMKGTAVAFGADGNSAVRCQELIEAGADGGHVVIHTLSGIRHLRPRDGKGNEHMNVTRETAITSGLKEMGRRQAEWVTGYMYIGKKNIKGKQMQMRIRDIALFLPNLRFVD
jgi:hypothetical protein